MILLTAMSLAAALANNSPDVIMVNKQYALMQSERGLVCYGCQDKPVIVQGSETLGYGDNVFVEANSAQAAFITKAASAECPAGEQYVVNLAAAKIERLNVPCQAKDYEWTFSERLVTYRYHLEGKTYAFKFAIKM